MMKTIRPPAVMSQVAIRPQPMKARPMAMKKGQYVGSGSRVGLAGNVSVGGGEADSGVMIQGYFMNEQIGNE
jgi:hypothetical protein